MLGALIICIDLLIRKIPTDTCRDFRIQNSNAFLSSSLSLSFGVMVYPLRAAEILALQLTLLSFFHHYTKCFRRPSCRLRMVAFHGKLRLGF